MSQPMSFNDLAKLLKHCAAEHSPMNIGECMNRRIVKYVDPHVDLRDGKVFSVGFRGFGWDEVIHTQNECRDLSETLLERCMKFLDKCEPHSETVKTAPKEEYPVDNDDGGISFPPAKIVARRTCYDPTRVEQLKSIVRELADRLEKHLWKYRKRNDFPLGLLCSDCGVEREWAKENGHLPDCLIRRSRELLEKP